MFNHKLFKKNIDIAIKIAATGFAYKTFYSNLSPAVPNDWVPASKELSDEVNLQAQTMGIKQPVTVYTSNATSGATVGVNGPGKWNSMSVAINPSKPNNRFIMSHELAHLKNNDYLATNLIVMTGFHMVFLNVPAIAPLLFVGAAMLTYGRYYEKRADLTAAEHLNNIEIAGVIRNFSNERADMLKYRNTPGEKLWFDIIKKLKISTSGDHLFCSDFPFLDVHPSHSSRIDYLKKFIDQRKEEDPNIEFAYQTAENGPLTEVSLTREQSLLLRTIIQNSPKKDAYNTLGRIVLLAGNTKGNVRLFHYGENSPIPFDFDPEVIKNQQLLPAIIETILHSPARTSTPLEISSSIPLHADYMLEVNKAIRVALNIAPEEQLHIIYVSDSHTSTLDNSKQYFVAYTGKQLSLTSDRCFEPPVTAENTRPSPC